jgi:signal transduction histidine kinase
MISHEVNNSVGAVSSLLESAAGLVAEQGGGEDGTERIAEALAVARARLGRLRKFVSGYAEVVRLPEPERRPCDVATLLDEILILLGPELARRRIEHRWTERADVPPIELDRNQMEQVLVNVLKNAMEAIGEDGTIELSLTRGSGGAGGRAGIRTTLAIRDSGPGLAPEVRERLFTPFFSTKRDGRGLGLTLAHEVLTRHGFDHTLRNRPEGGAELVIRF